MTKTLMAVGAVALIVSLAVIGLLRVAETPEWVVLRGDEAARAAACRSVYQKSARRATFMLHRLLADPSAAVRVAAIEAAHRHPAAGAAVLADIAALAADSHAGVKARALEYLLRDAQVEVPWLERAAQALDDADFRANQPELLELVVHRQARAGETSVVDRALQWLDEDAQVVAALEALRQYPDMLRPRRDDLVDRLDAAGPAARIFLVTALATVDGVMRGYDARDWRVDAAAPPANGALATVGDRFTVEAEWMFGLRPNYQIETHDGELCLYLGEGAGGRLSWRADGKGSVDIGEGFVPFTLDRAGHYQLWLRGWFLDKCGNATGVAVDGEILGVYNNHDNDTADRYRAWHWKRVAPRVHLDAGRHVLSVKALEDGSSVDRYALLPADETFDPERPPPRQALFDSATPSSISIRAETQTQEPGTTQTLSLWVRRNRPELKSGEIAVTVQPPFELASPAVMRINFSTGSPLAEYRVLVRLPQDAARTEAALTAELRVDGTVEAIGQTALGVPLPWLTTGPLAAADPRCQELLARPNPSDEDLSRGWTNFPAAGFDRYRRLDFERAYGEQADQYIFLVTDIMVDKPGDYRSLLTLDDLGELWIDGQRVSGRAESRAGEGDLMTADVTLDRGRHRVFLWVYQSAFHDATGPGAVYHTPNHWVAKWLLRRDRDTIARGIRGIAPIRK